MSQSEIYYLRNENNRHLWTLETCLNLPVLHSMHKMKKNLYKISKTFTNVLKMVIWPQFLLHFSFLFFPFFFSLFFFEVKNTLSMNFVELNVRKRLFCLKRNISSNDIRSDSRSDGHYIMKLVRLPIFIDKLSEWQFATVQTYHNNTNSNLISLLRVFFFPNEITK